MAEDSFEFIPEEKPDFTDIAWEVVFGEKLEKIPDPNKPENAPYFKAKRREKKEKIKVFAQGIGKPVFDHWKNKIRRNIMAVILNNQCNTCHCANCMLIREIQYLFNLILDTESIIQDSK